MEYALILVLVAVVVIVILAVAGESVSKVYGDVVCSLRYQQSAIAGNVYSGNSNNAQNVYYDRDASTPTFCFELKNPGSPNPRYEVIGLLQ